MARDSMDQLCDKLIKIGSETTQHLFGSPEERKAFDPALYARTELSDDFLRTLPFGGYLADSANFNPQKKPGQVDDARIHMLYVISGVVGALSGDKAKFPSSSNEFVAFHAKLMSDTTAEGFKEEILKKVCIVAALYHDIGKAIAGERHPYEGFHMVKDLGQVEMVEDLGQAPIVSGKPNKPKKLSASKDFRTWFEEAIEIEGIKGIEKEKEANYYFRFFTKLLRYHDMWGNITTGEASMVMLSSAIDLDDRPPGAIVFLGHLLLLNLADQFGTKFLFDKVDRKPIKLDNAKLQSLLAHWKVVYKVLEESGGNPEIVHEMLLKKAGQATETVDRLYALLKESEINIKGKTDVDDILKDVCGGRYYAFCEDFGVMRLSYALRFFRELGKMANEQNKILPPDRKVTPYRQASLVIAVLKRILDTYEALIQANKQQRRETGIEMSWLSRSDKVLSSIIRALLGLEREAALSWIDDEVSAYPCD